MPRWIAAILLVVVSGSIGNCGEVSDEELKSFEQAIKSPRTFETKPRSGQVVDVSTGLPVEGAVVVYTWDVSMFGLESRTQKAAQYEATTDKNGRYFIPNQKVTVEGALTPDLEPEYVFVYKKGYVWYRVYHNQPQSFMEYVPNLNQKYQKEDNIVKLQPWNEKLSHSEHIGIFERMREYVGPKLEEALRQEREIAKKEEPDNNGFDRQTYKIGQQIRKDSRTFEDGKIDKIQYIQLLHTRLESDNVEAVTVAARELNKLGDKSGVEALIKSLKARLYRKDFGRVLGGIIVITGREDLEYLQDTRIISERVKIIQDLENWWQRNKGRGQTESIAELLISDGSDKEKGEVLNKLQLSGDKSAAPYLVQFLSMKGQKAGLYETALYLLSKISDKSAVEAVKPMLYHPDIYVRQQAALTLNALGDKGGVPIMIATLSSESRNSRSVANAVLREVAGQDFAEGESLRTLPADREKKVIKKWLEWWGQNREAIKGEEPKGFPGIMAGEEVAMRLRYMAIEEEEKNNPDLPVFEAPTKTPKATFEQFRAALLKDDVKTALSLMTYPLNENYKKIFEQLGAHRRDYAKGLGRIYFSMKLGNVLYYEMVTEQDDGLAAFPVHFVQDDEGKWLITEF